MNEEKKLLVKLVVEGEPLSPVNNYQAGLIGGKRGSKAKAIMFMPKRHKDYKNNFVEEIKKQIPQELMDSPSEKDIFINAHFYMGTRRRKDLPNMGKLEYDALNGLVYRDDSQIVSINSRKTIRDPRPRVELEIYELTGNE